MELALNGTGLKLKYKNGPLDFQSLGVLTASDASFADEVEANPSKAGPLRRTCKAIAETSHLRA